MSETEISELRLVESSEPSAKRPLPQRTVYSEESRLQRLENLEQQTGVRLEKFKTMRLDSKSLRGNIESLIGAVEVPIGVAGPLLIHGTHFEEEVFAPIATTEGALVSSVSRGCRAISMSGGVTARVIKQRMVRAPLFECGTLKECLRLKNWVESRRNEIQKRVREYSNHAVLVDLEFTIIPPCTHVRFIYETGDASGQNMTTVCTWNICQWIVENYNSDGRGGIRHFMVEGNLSTDKKASYASSLFGRGKEVAAEVIIKEAVLRRVFNVKAEHMVQLYHQSQSTQVATGVHGMNINVANIIAGIFTATGQDIACVHESSTAQLHFELRGKDLYASLLLPSLVVGTVGGGVSVATQRQMLEMMNCYGSGKSARLAEIIASYALALELSTGAALVSGAFAEAHERLGRNKARTWLDRSDVNVNFMNHLIKDQQKGFAPIIEVNELPLKKSGESFVMAMAGQISKRPSGFWLYDTHFANSTESKKVLLKCKVPDSDLLLAFEIVAGLRSPGLGELLRENRKDSPFVGSHVRELEIANLPDQPLAAVRPQYYGSLQNRERQTYILAQEYLEDVLMMETVNNRDLWKTEHREIAITDLSKVHAHFASRTSDLIHKPWMSVTDAAKVLRMQEAHFELARQLSVDCVDWFTDDDLKFHERKLNLLPQIWDEAQAMPQTLIHNDFNPRNIAFRHRDGQPTNLVAYDWELATIGLPQRDIAELLCFTLPIDVSTADLKNLIELHRRNFQDYSGISVSSETWQAGFTTALLEVILHRLPVYVIPQTLKPLGFLRPSYRTARRMYDLLMTEK